MPAGFEKCVSGGGKVRTMTGPNKKMGLSEGQFVRICISKGGNVHRGEVKTRKAPKNAS